MALPSTVTEHELWALALKVERDYGEDAARHIVEQVEAAALLGNQVRVDLWKAVAVRFDQLQDRGHHPARPV